MPTWTREHVYAKCCLHARKALLGICSSGAVPLRSNYCGCVRPQVKTVCAGFGARGYCRGRMQDDRQPTADTSARSRGAFGAPRCSPWALQALSWLPDQVSVAHLLLCALISSRQLTALTSLESPKIGTTARMLGEEVLHSLETIIRSDATVMEAPPEVPRLL